MTETASASGATTLRAQAFTAAHLDAAAALGRAAGDRAADPADVVTTLRDGLSGLADPEHLALQRRVAPGIGEILGVRNALLGAVSRGLRSATRLDRSSTLLDIAEHLQRESSLELHWLAFDLLERVISTDPERSWQLVRKESRSTADWITVDSLAHVAGRGILAEPYRWAELEQLVYSPSRWERRLVGSTVATIPYVDRTAGRRPEVARHGLDVVGDLIGDAEPDVQKSLSWALRSLTIVDAPAVIAFLERETGRAAGSGDGHRAWVIRDTLGRVPAPVASRLRGALAGVRRHPGTPSTSRASATAADFLGLGVGVPPAERPVVART
jgi:3-methyladenine DNA glycosylase AlkD